VTTTTTSYGALVCEEEHNIYLVSDSILCRWLLFDISVAAARLILVEPYLGSTGISRAAATLCLWRRTLTWHETVVRDSGTIWKVTHERFSRRVQQLCPSTFLELQRST